MLEIKNLHVNIEDKEILKSVLVRAKEYYRNPEYKQRLQAVIEEELNNG